MIARTITVLAVFGLGFPFDSVAAQKIETPPLQLAPPTRLSLQARVFVRAFRFEGNTAFSSAELATVTAPFVGRELTFEELEDARRAVTLYYVQRGYINSGAILPDQRANNGVVTMRLVEGVLSEVWLTGNQWLRDGYIKDRVQRWSVPPLNINRLREGLQLLRQNPNVQQVNAELKAGAVPGQSCLDIRVQDENPFRLGLQIDNARPPSVGSDEIVLLAADRNLTGHSDPLEIDYGIGEGGYGKWKFSDFANVGGSYALPLTRFDTTLSVYGNRNDFAIIDPAFTTTNHVNIGVTSDSYRIGGSVRQPVYQTSSREFALAVAFERRFSETFVFGQPFDISPGSVNGQQKISALRLSQEWIDRGLNQVLAVRSTFSVGLDAFGATDDGTDRNAKFWAWLGQAQYVRRLGNTPSQLILRAAGQWTDDQLLSLEQFSVGGADTVRGYRENEFVRDRGMFASAELRVPLLCNKAGAPIVQAAPFSDFGGGWNVGADTPGPTTISSAGIGVLFTPDKHLRAQLYWGHAFRDIDVSGHDLQDSGIHFRVNFEAF